ncbi:UvrB/uvrC motif family protein [Zea mays]|uniref:UvrB/uvrC motif family protein n=1 Tax=Zea mays TaxID=4577 RepID=A0A1D6KJ44_MAIZE|nr:UvrB/uvrC motif family protein [Zea mays]
MASRDDGWGGGEDGSSLFEGMVLFAPEPTAAEDSVPAPAPVPELPSAARHDADAASSVPPPLDEDLFSDLTLFAPPQEPLSLEQTPPPLLPQGEDRSHAALAPAPLAPTPGLSRQPSTSSLRKKKRAVRIGYARSPQPAPPSPPATVPASAAAAAISASTIAFLDASPYPAATRTLDQLPDRQLDVHVNGYEAHAEAVDVDTNSPHVEEEAKEDDDGKEDEDAGVAALGVKERLGLLRSQISGKLDSIQQRAAAVAAKRRLLAGRRRKVAEEATSVASRHKDLERELEVACEAEDFERAESISDSLAALEKEKDGLLTALRDAELDYDSVDSELQEVLESRIAAEEEAAILLEQFAKEVSSRRTSIQQEMDSFKQKLSFIDKRGPELEAEKKVAAAARNFKEAGRIAAEAKALNSEKNELRGKLEKAATDLELIEKDIAATTDKIQECEGLVVLKEKDSALTSYKRLRLDCAAARAELTAATEIHDNEEVEILRKEAETADSKAMELKTCYDLQVEDNDFMFQPVVPIAFITNSTGQHLVEIASSFGLSPQK